MTPARWRHVIGIAALRERTIAPRLVTMALLSVLLWLSGLHGAEAGVNEWTSNGPRGGPVSVSALAIDPLTPTTLYAGTVGGLSSRAPTGAPPGAIPA